MDGISKLKTFSIASELQPQPQTYVTSERKHEPKKLKYGEKEKTKPETSKKPKRSSSSATQTHKGAFGQHPRRQFKLPNKR